MAQRSGCDGGMPSPTPRRRFAASARWLMLAMAVPCLVSLLMAGWGLPAVVSTGLCPPAPPDILAYPCTPLDYVMRMTLGPWSFIGHVLIWMVWWGLVGAAWLLVFLVQSRWKQGRTPIKYRRIE